MSDQYEQDPDEVAKILRRVREAQSQVWGNKVASAEVTPGMVQHTESPARCICDACAGKRPHTPLPVSLGKVLVNRHKHHRLLFADKFERPVLEERGPSPRKPVRMNRPRKAWPAPSGRYGSKLWGG